MRRMISLIAFGGAVLTSSMAFGQGPMMPPPPMSPYGNPGMHGYPGYPPPLGPLVLPNSQGMMPPSGAMPPGVMPPPPYGMGMPMMPWGPASLNPGLPKGTALPTYVPADPRKPVGVPPNSPISKPLPTEPYLMLPGKAPDAPKSAPKEAFRAPLEQPMTPAYVTPVACVEPALPSEPYTLYEGRRYLAEVKKQEYCGWAQLSFIHWRVNGDNTAPLATTGTAGGGVIGNPNTVVLIGNGSIDAGEHSGAQLTLGMWCDPEHLCGIEVSGTWLGRRSRQTTVSSDAVGNPILLRPIVVGGVEGAFPIAAPGIASGSFTANNGMTFHTLELNAIRTIFRYQNCWFDGLAGFRYAYLNDTLDLTQNTRVLSEVGGLIFRFNGAAVPIGGNVLINDHFNLTNRFYGGQIGARVGWVHCSGFDVTATAKLALGMMTHNADVNGSSSIIANGVTTTTPGGLLALPSNSGSFSHTDFSVISDVSATVGYQVAPCLRVFAGYNFLMWTQVQRAGDQVNRNVSLNQVPTLGTFVPGAIGTNPTFPGSHSTFWAHGVNVGLELRF